MGPLLLRRCSPLLGGLLRGVLGRDWCRLLARLLRRLQRLGLRRRSVDGVHGVDHHRLVGALAGVLAGSLRAGAAAGCGKLGFIYVAPDRWRSGIGRELLRVGVDYLRDRGFQEATPWVFEANDLARAFYEVEGWTSDGARVETSRWGAPVVRYRVQLAENAP